MLYFQVRTNAASADAEAAMLPDLRRELMAIDDQLPVIAMETRPIYRDRNFELWVLRAGAFLAMLGSQLREFPVTFAWALGGDRASVTRWVKAHAVPAALLYSAYPGLSAREANTLGAAPGAPGVASPASGASPAVPFQAVPVSAEEVSPCAPLGVATAVGDAAAAL